MSKLSSTRSSARARVRLPLLFVGLSLSLLLGACGSYSEISPYPAETAPQTNIEFSLKKDDFGVFNFARDFLIGKDAGVNNKDDKGVVNGTAQLIGDLALTLTSWVLEGATAIRFDWPSEERNCASNSEFISVTPLAKCVTKVYDDIVSGLLWGILSLSLSYFVIKYLLQQVFPQMQSSFFQYAGRVLAVLVLIPLAGLLLTIVADLPIKLFLAILGTDTKLSELKVLFDINGTIHKGSIVFATVLSLLSVLTAIPVLMIGLMILVRNLALVFWFLLSPFAICAQLFDETSAFFSQWKNRVISMSVSILPVAGVFKVAILLQSSLKNFTDQPFQLILMMFFQFLLFATSFVIAWRLFNAEMQTSLSLLRTAYSVAKGYATGGLSLAGKVARAPGRVGAAVGEAFDSAGSALFGEEHVSPSGTQSSTGLMGRAFPGIGPWKYSERGIGNSQSSRGKSGFEWDSDGQSNPSRSSNGGTSRGLPMPDATGGLSQTALSRDLASMTSAMHNMNLLMHQLVKQQQQGGATSFGFGFGGAPGQRNYGGYTSLGFNTNTNTNASSGSGSGVPGAAGTEVYGYELTSSQLAEAGAGYIGTPEYVESSGVIGEVNYGSNLATSTGSSGASQSAWPAPVSVTTGMPQGLASSFPTTATSTRVVPAPNMLSTLNGKLPVYDPKRRQWVHYLPASDAPNSASASASSRIGQEQPASVSSAPARPQPIPVRPVTRVVPANPGLGLAPLYPSQHPAQAVPALAPLPPIEPAKIVPPQKEAQAEALGQTQARGATLLSGGSAGSGSDSSEALNKARLVNNQTQPLGAVATPSSAPVLNANSSSSLSGGNQNQAAVVVPSPPLPPAPPRLPLPPIVSPMPIGTATSSSSINAQPLIGVGSEGAGEAGVGQSEIASSPGSSITAPNLVQSVGTSGVNIPPPGIISLPTVPGGPLTESLIPSPPPLASGVEVSGNSLLNPVQPPSPVKSSLEPHAVTSGWQEQEMANRSVQFQTIRHPAQSPVELPTLPKFAATPGSSVAPAPIAPPLLRPLPVTDKTEDVGGSSQ